MSRNGHLVLVESWDLGVNGLVACLSHDLLVFHHQEDLDETRDARGRFGVPYVALQRAEVKNGISLRPAEGVSNTADFYGITYTS
jgi:hypothetical protein